MQAKSATATFSGARPPDGAAQWTPVVLWAVLIFVLSTEYFSSASTARIIVPILQWLMPAASAVTVESLHGLIRKSAHFTEYSILFWLLLRGPMAGRPYLALAVCALYAFSDEGHQIFVPGRTASIYDVGIDFSGALFSRFLHLAIIEIV
jgi:VanZ family protein